ncbi:MAG: heme-binding protein [Betaproteobacteria bacterium]|nr:heme-binding protein [Betaproteobacteria bacterium]
MIEMKLEDALIAARAALEKAVEMNKPMTASVVDESGRLVVTLRGDGTGFLTTETSRAKAVASVNFKRPTIDMVDLAKSNPFWTHVATVSRAEALPTGGAVPIVRGGRVIGAIGCGGGTPEEDHICAEHGALAIVDNRVTL